MNTNMASTPQFIFDLLQTELISINRELLKRVVNKYDLDENEVINEFLPTKLKIIPNEKKSVEIVHKATPRKPPENEKQRCMARVWNRGKGGQCIRFRIKNCEFCCQHKEKIKHGRIDEEVPRELFQKQSNAIYK